MFATAAASRRPRASSAACPARSSASSCCAAPTCAPCSPPAASRPTLRPRLWRARGLRGQVGHRPRRRRPLPQLLLRRRRLRRPARPRPGRRPGRTPAAASAAASSRDTLRRRPGRRPGRAPLHRERRDAIRRDRLARGTGPTPDGTVARDAPRELPIGDALEVVRTESGRWFRCAAAEAALDRRRRPARTRPGARRAESTPSPHSTATAYPTSSRRPPVLLSELRRPLLVRRRPRAATARSPRDAARPSGT